MSYDTWKQTEPDEPYADRPFLRCDCCGHTWPVDDDVELADGAEVLCGRCEHFRDECRAAEEVDRQLDERRSA